MLPQDIISLLRADPFEPFSVWLTDGAKFDIHNPVFALVDYSKLTLGLPTNQSADRPAERTVYLGLSHITRIEPIKKPTARKK